MAIKHGMTRINGQITPTYLSWQRMKSRCSNPNAVDFARYGGRGIQVCDRWHSFENFLADMGERPEGLQLDRINNDGNYEPRNCRWVSKKENARNRSSNIQLTVNCETHTAIEWSEKTGISAAIILGRISRGWDHEKAVSTPPDSRFSGPRKAK